METDSLHLFQGLQQQLNCLSETVLGTRISCLNVGGFHNHAYLIATITTSAWSLDLTRFGGLSHGDGPLLFL